MSHNKTEETKNTLCLCIIHTHLHVSEEGRKRRVYQLKLDFLLVKTTFLNQISCVPDATQENVSYISALTEWGHDLG